MVRGRFFLVRRNGCERNLEKNMGGFILLILCAAWVQSICKLSLMPRAMRWLILTGAVLPVFFFREVLASSSLRSVEEFLSGGEYLRDFCALVVIQELLALVVGLSLLKERELGWRIHRWKYLSLLPSLLLPAGALYGVAVAFHTVLRYSFTQIMWGTGVLLVLSSGALCELFRVWKKRENERIGAALSGSWMLLLLAVFLPAAVEGNLSSGTDSPAGNWAETFCVLGILTLITALSCAGFQWVGKNREKKTKCVT